MSDIHAVRDKYEAVIGLEVHVQLQTKSKIFSSASAAYGAEPNTQVAEVDLGLPGVLPVLNRTAVEYAMRAGLALNCEVRQWSQFARKNYFYPDLPKGYQISQFEHPLCEGGQLDIELDDGTEKTVGITRIHMEEDAGKSSHVEDRPYSLVDLNRAGVPLIEIVGEPDLRSADEAVAYLKELRNIVVYLGITDGNMQEGSFRCDSNVSVRPTGQKELGTRTELKNINSFKFIKDAINFEIARQIDVLEEGGEIIQETRLYSPDRGETFAMRSKEESHDYRYFPDPDLPALVIDDAWLQEVRESLPELPAEKRARYATEYELGDYDAGVLTDDRQLAEYYELAVEAYPDNPKDIANWVINELLGRLDAQTTLESLPVKPAQLAELVELIDEDVISGKIAKDVFEEMLESGDDPEQIVEDKGLKQISDEDALAEIIDGIIADNPDQVGQYREGNTNIVGWFVGQVMQATRGQANPQLANKMLREMLERE
ncbi:MAG: Asp-tRNA(Asn)/Glu-tRNA(Gln) amidotransferase subunit GatB [Persicimonas sp.]